MSLPEWFLDPENKDLVPKLRKYLLEQTESPGKPIPAVTTKEFWAFFNEGAVTVSMNREACSVLRALGWSSISIDQTKYWRPPAPSPWRKVPFFKGFRDAYESYAECVASPVSVQQVLGWVNREIVRSQGEGSSREIDLNGLMAQHAAIHGDEDIWRWPEYDLRESVEPRPEDCYTWDPAFMYEMIDEFIERYDKIVIGHVMTYMGLDQKQKSKFRTEVQDALEHKGFLRPKHRGRWWVRKPPQVARTPQERKTTQQRILCLFEEHNTLTSREIQKLTGLSTSQVNKDVKDLIDKEKLDSFGQGSARTLFRA